MSRARTWLAGLLALTLVSVAVPAAAQAEAFWYEEGEKVGAEAPISGGTELLLSGTLNGSGVSMLCQVSYSGTVSNEPISGTGTVESVVFELCLPYFANEAFKNCVVFQKMGVTPWTIVAIGTGPFAVGLAEVETTLEFATSGGPPTCPLHSKTLYVRGNIGGEWENGKPSFLRFKEAAGLSVFNEFNEKIGEITLNGNFSAFAVGEGAMTLEGK